MRRSIFLLLALVGAAAARELLAPTPTQQLNAQKAAQQQAQAQQAQAAAARSQAAQRLKPPCYVPSSWYPIASCVVSTDNAVCGRGFLAFPTEKHCCTPQRGPLGAFPAGCTDVGKELSCWTAGSWHPTQTCALTTDFATCNRNWGKWSSEEDCCRPGAAFQTGCSVPEPCYIAGAFWPERKCARTEDQSVCQRGWGSYPDEAQCCSIGAAFSDGCGMVDAPTT